MPWIVDGDNLLGSWPGRSRSDAERRTLAGEIRALARREGREIVVVFDGEPASALASGGDVLYAGKGRDADSVILEKIRASRDRRGYTVVTFDRALADQTRWLGASVERCDRFRARLAADRPAEKPEAGDDLEEWERIFRDEDESTQR